MIATAVVQRSPDDNPPRSFGAGKLSVRSTSTNTHAATSQDSHLGLSTRSANFAVSQATDLSASRVALLVASCLSCVEQVVTFLNANCRLHAGDYSRFDKGMTTAVNYTFIVLAVLVFVVVFVLLLRKQLTEYRRAAAAADAAAAQRARREKEAREQATRDAKAAAPTIAFVVLELTGKVLHITTLSPLHTVDELKQAVAVATGGQVEQMQLVLKQKLLDDERMTLGECGVVMGSTVSLAIKSAGIEEAVPLQGQP